MNEVADKISGVIYASEPLNGQAPARRSFLRDYSKGVDVWNVDENASDAWMANGHNDTIPYLHRLIYQRSAMHQGAVNIKADLVAGGGLDFEPLEEYYRKNEDGFYDLVEEALSDSAKQDVVKQAKLFAKNTGMGSYLKYASKETTLYGGYYGFRTYMLDSKAETLLRRLYIEPYINMRMGSKRTFVEDGFVSDNHYVSDNWREASPYQVDAYSDLVAGNVRKRLEGNVYRIPVDKGDVYQTKVPGIYSKFNGRISPYRFFYATPDYESLDALCYMDIDYMLSQRDFKDLNTGFSLDYVVVRYRSKKATGAEEQAQRKKDVEFFKKKFTGFDGDKTLMVWAEPTVDDTGKVQSPKMLDVIPIPNNNTAERYNVLREERLMKILNAHCIVTGEIVGLPRLSSTGFSSQAEFLITAQEHLYWSVIDPLQQIIVKDIQEIFIDAGIPVKPVIKKSLANYRALSDQMIQWAFGVDEFREMIGHARMSEEVAREVMERSMRRDTSGNNGPANNPNNQNGE